YVNAQESSIEVTSSATSVATSTALPIPNSGFETPSLKAGQAAAIPSGSDWTYTVGPDGATAGISANGTYGITESGPNTLATINAPQGTQAGFIEGNSSISQTINLTSAQ